ncbi:MAG: hypothetical protein ACJ8DV_02160, partial [Microvirga sp.]
MSKPSLYFNATTEEHGAELYYLPQGGARATLIDLIPGSVGSDPAGFITLEHQIYFSAYAPGHGYELYSLAPGSSKPSLIEIESGRESSSPHNFTVYKGQLYFTATTAANGSELYRLSPESNVPTLIDINPDRSGPNSYTVGSDPKNFHIYKGSLYFTAFTEARGEELYRLSTDSSKPA